MANATDVAGRSLGTVLWLRDGRTKETSRDCIVGRATDAARLPRDSVVAEAAGRPRVFVLWLAWRTQKGGLELLICSSRDDRSRGTLRSSVVSRASDAAGRSQRSILWLARRTQQGGLEGLCCSTPRGTSRSCVVAIAKDAAGRRRGAVL